VITFSLEKRTIEKLKNYKIKSFQSTFEELKRLPLPLRDLQKSRSSCEPFPFWERFLCFYSGATFGKRTK